MRDRRLEFDDGPPPIDRIGDAPQDTDVAKLLNQPEPAAHRDIDRHAKRGDRQLLTLALVDEEIDQHFPRGIAEKLGSP